MKYILDLLLVAGLVWMGHLWNAEKEHGRAQAGQIDQLNVQVAKLALEGTRLGETGAKAAEELAAARNLLDRTSKDLRGTADALEAKTAEAAELRTAAAALQARVDELQGYKDLAKQAVLEERPTPAEATP